MSKAFLFIISTIHFNNKILMLKTRLTPHTTRSLNAPRSTLHALRSTLHAPRTTLHALRSLLSAPRSSLSAPHSTLLLPHSIITFLLLKTIHLSLCKKRILNDKNSRQTVRKRSAWLQTLRALIDRPMIARRQKPKSRM